MSSFLKGLIYFVCIILIPFSLRAQYIKVIETGRETNLRGLSVVNNKVAWVSGSKGNVGLTKDGGKTWNWQQIKNYEKADFRDIEAFSEKEAIIMASGTPAVILKTNDGGTNWQQVYFNNNETYFLDAMDFSSQNQGWVLGDPVDGKFILLQTNDGGNTWIERKDIAPNALEGEAAFAASGTCLRSNTNQIFITTGAAIAGL